MCNDVPCAIRKMYNVYINTSILYKYIGTIIPTWVDGADEALVNIHPPSVSVCVFCTTSTRSVSVESVYMYIINKAFRCRVINAIGIVVLAYMHSCAMPNVQTWEWSVLASTYVPIQCMCIYGLICSHIGISSCSRAIWGMGWIQFEPNRQNR